MAEFERNAIKLRGILTGGIARGEKIEQHQVRGNKSSLLGGRPGIPAPLLSLLSNYVMDAKIVFAFGTRLIHSRPQFLSLFFAIRVLDLRTARNLLLVHRRAKLCSEWAVRTQTSRGPSQLEFHHFTVRFLLLLLRVGTVDDVLKVDGDVYGLHVRCECEKVQHDAYDEYPLSHGGPRAQATVQGAAVRVGLEVVQTSERSTGAHGQGACDAGYSAGCSSVADRGPTVLGP